MATQAPPQGPAPGSLFRVPKYTTAKRYIPDAQNNALATTLAAAASTTVQTGRLDRLDILKSLLILIDVTETYTPGSGKTITQSPLFPYNWVNEIDVQFESAFKTFRMPGFLAAAMQQYRPLYDWKGNGMLFQNGVNVQQGEVVTSVWPGTPSQTGLTGPSVSDATSPLHLAFEIPLAFEFDLYWELDKAGNPLSSMPLPRAIVSPQYMSGTNRNVKPTIIMNAGMLTGASGQALLSPATIAAGDTTSTFSGSTVTSIYRDGWFAPSSLAPVPPIMRWQYSRDFITVPTNGQLIVPVPLDADPAGQGQILSLILVVWDPALNSGAGGVVPLSQVSTVELLFGSSLDMFNDTIQTNAYRWGEQHGVLLPAGFFGWDLALDDSSRLTNEFALNTLITAGCQVRITYKAGQATGSTATVYCGLEMLKAVSS